MTKIFCDNCEKDITGNVYKVNLIIEATFTTNSIDTDKAKDLCLSCKEYVRKSFEEKVK